VVTRPPRAHPRDLARSAEVRDRARRQTQADRVAHLRPVDQETRGTSNNLRGVERRLKAERADRVAAARSRGGAAGDGPIAADRGRPGSGNPRATRPGTRGLTRQDDSTGGVVRRGNSDRRGASGTTVTGRKAARPTDNRGSGTRTSQGTRGTAPRADRGEATRQRMRDVYESMSGPRSTRDRRGESTSRSSRGSSGSRPKAAPSRSSGGSRPKASPSRGSGGSRPKASPGRSSGGSRPKASPGRSSGGSRPKASSSRRSGGSRPKASSSRGKKKD